MKSATNFVALLAMGLDARIVLQKNIGMVTVPTSAYGVVPLAMATAAPIARPENTKSKIIYEFSEYGNELLWQYLYLWGGVKNY